jgi:hypothetical protein
LVRSSELLVRGHYSQLCRCLRLYSCACFLVQEGLAGLTKKHVAGRLAAIFCSCSFILYIMSVSCRFTGLPWHAKFSHQTVQFLLSHIAQHKADAPTSRCHFILLPTLLNHVPNICRTLSVDATFFLLPSQFLLARLSLVRTTPGILRT